VSNLSHIEQNFLGCHFEIVGVPECKHQTCEKTVKNIITKLGINATLNDVFRMPSKVLKNQEKSQYALIQ